MARKQRTTGTLIDLQRVLWRTIVEVEGLLDTRPPSNDILLRCAHAMAQLAGSYARLVQVTEIEARLQKLEREVGHHESQAHVTPNGRHR